MEASWLDRVRVDASGYVVEISRDELDALVGKIGFVAGCETIVAKFEAAGADRPVELDYDEQEKLCAALEVWEDVAPDELPEGLMRLLVALVHAESDKDVGTI